MKADTQSASPVVEILSSPTTMIIAPATKSGPPRFDCLVSLIAGHLLVDEHSLLNGYHFDEVPQGGRKSRNRAVYRQGFSARRPSPTPRPRGDPTSGSVPASDRSGKAAVAGDLAGPPMAHAVEVGDLDDADDGLPQGSTLLRSGRESQLVHLVVRVVPHRAARRNHLGGHLRRGGGTRRAGTRWEFP